MWGGALVETHKYMVRNGQMKRGKDSITNNLRMTRRREEGRKRKEKDMKGRAKRGQWPGVKG